MASPQKPAGFVPDGFEPDAPAAAPSVTPPTTAPSAPEQPRSMLGDALEVGKGFVKGAASTAASLGDMAGSLRSPFNPAGGNLREAVDVLYGKPSLSRSAFAAADEDLTAQNPQQLAGKFAEGVAEMAIPVTKAAQAIPSAARAGQKFQQVMAAAKDIPVNPEAAGQVGLRIMQIAERGGGSLPQPVRQFLGWVTNPEKAPLTYEVARDFASGISRLSANEMGRLSPVVAREVAELRVVLNKAVAEAASRAGQGQKYAQAMNEYAKAKRLSGMIDDVVTGAKRAAPYAGAAGAATWLTSKMLGLMGKD